MNDRSPTAQPAPRVSVHAHATESDDDVLTPDAWKFLILLHDRFEATRQALLSRRGTFRANLRNGHTPGFLEETEGVRNSEWKVPSAPEELRDRRVEITAPVDRKTVINALNSGACVYMADFEDAHSPTWLGTIAGQRNLRDAVRRKIKFVTADGRDYRLGPHPATLMVRPRGWHLNEGHVKIDGTPISAALFDFGLYFHHNARELLARGTRPYFYLPKLEHYLEARLWNDVLRTSEEALGIPLGTTRVTALIETLPAAFQMEEILFELREHSVGLNCGRWDYLFSFIKQYRDDPGVRFPDRGSLTMTTPFLTAYSRLLIQTCHRRGAHAIGGMAAQIPIKGDPAANERAFALVAADKDREVRAGHDGTWVAHPGLVPLARRIFDAVMTGPNQIDAPPTGSPVAPAELIQLPGGPISEEGVRRNVRVSVRYLDAWFRGIGCVPIDHLMEDAATVEIARSQLWQWIHHRAATFAGATVGVPLFRRLLASEIAELGSEAAPGTSRETLDRTARLLDRVVTAPDLAEFITLEAYEDLEELTRSS